MNGPDLATTYLGPASPLTRWWSAPPRRSVADPDLIPRLAEQALRPWCFIPTLPRADRARTGRNGKHHAAAWQAREFC